jgi:hypothetical protein
MTPTSAPVPADEEWRGDFGAAEKRRLELSLAATPSERLRWLEEALAFTARSVRGTRRDERRHSAGAAKPRQLQHGCRRNATG